jgi:hypothetical protein
MSAAVVSKDNGEWLRKQRQSRGWNVPEMCRQLRQAAGAVADKLPGNDCLTTMIRRWENGAGVSERYRLHYCRAFRLRPDEFADASVVASVGESAARPLAESGAKGVFRFPALPNLDYGENPTAFPGRSSIESEVLMTAHEGSEFAERAEWRDIGDATLEQLRAEVIRLSREYLTGQPLPLFFEMRRIRGRLHAALDRRIWPRDETELYFLLGSISALMADAAHDLGSSPAAEELARSGWAYATVIDHRPLKGWLRIMLAAIARWADQPIRSRDLAISGLQYLKDGPNGAQLHLLHAMAAARLGDADTARQEITAAQRARDQSYHDELLEIGGELGFSLATQHYRAGSVVVEIPGGESDAIAELERAMELYAAGPGPGEAYSIHCRMAAQVDLARARLRAGQLDAAESAVGPVLVLPPGQRISSLPQRLGRVREELASPLYHGSALARGLDEQIEHFCRDTIAARLSDLPASSA